MATRKQRETTAIVIEESAADDRQANNVTEEQIRTRAYFLSLERDGGSADPLVDWLRAEHELAGGGSEDSTS